MLFKVTILLLLALIAVADESQPWTVHRLWAKLQISEFKRTHVHDLANVLTPSTKRDIDEISDAIKTFDIRIVIVDRFWEGIYEKYREAAMEHIAAELTRQVYTQIELESSFFILYALKDRQYIWRTGSLARKIIDDQACLRMSDGLKPFLRNGDFDLAFMSAVNSIKQHLLDLNYKVTVEKKEGSSFVFWMLPIIVIAVLLICKCYVWEVVDRKLNWNNRNLRRPQPQQARWQPESPNDHRPHMNGSYPDLDDEPSTNDGPRRRFEARDHRRQMLGREMQIGGGFNNLNALDRLAQQDPAKNTLIRGAAKQNLTGVPDSARRLLGNIPRGQEEAQEHIPSEQADPMQQKDSFLREYLVSNQIEETKLQQKQISQHPEGEMGGATGISASVKSKKSLKPKTHFNSLADKKTQTVEKGQVHQRHISPMLSRSRLIVCGI